MDGSSLSWAPLALSLSAAMLMSECITLSRRTACWSVVTAFLVRPSFYRSKAMLSRSPSLYTTPSRTVLVFKTVYCPGHGPSYRIPEEFLLIRTAFTCLSGTLRRADTLTSMAIVFSSPVTGPVFRSKALSLTFAFTSRLFDILTSICI